MTGKLRAGRDIPSGIIIKFNETGKKHGVFL